MIASWMLFACVTGVLFASVALLLERVLLRARKPVRWAWMGALCATVLLPLIALVPSEGASALAASARTASGSALVGAVATSAESNAVGAADGSFTPAMSVGRAMNDRPPLTSLRVQTALWELAPMQRFRTSTSSWDSLLLAAWLTASCVLGLGLVLVAYSFTRIASVVAATPKASSLHAVASDSAASSPIVLTDHVGPAAAGVLRPRILLPRWVMELEPVLGALVLRHEREHIAARDPLLLAFAALFVVLFPWHFPMWWLAHRLRVAVELDCDARVLRDAPDVRQYASLLMLVSARATPAAGLRAFMPAFLIALASRRSALAKRIIVMTQPHTSSRLRDAFPVLCALLLTAAAAALPAPPDAQSPPTVRTAGSQGADSVLFNMREVFGDNALVTSREWQSMLTPVRWYPRLFQEMAPRGSLTVRSATSHNVTVLVYAENPPGRRAQPSDTFRIATPFQLTRSLLRPSFHLRSADGSPLVVSAEIARVRGLRERVVGSHVVLDAGAPSDRSFGVTTFDPAQSRRCRALLAARWSLDDRSSCP